MELTRDMVLERKAHLQADMNAIAGALQDCDHWLRMIEEADGVELADLIPGATLQEVRPAKEVPA